MMWAKMVVSGDDDNVDVGVDDEMMMVKLLLAARKVEGGVN